MTTTKTIDRSLGVAVEEAVYAATRAAVGEAQLKTAALVEAIRDRSARYTSNREQLAQPASPQADLAARAAFFTLADAPKIAIPIGELRARGALPAHSPLRVIDLGAGCGAMSLGLLVATDGPLEITAIDRDRDALAIAADAIRAVGGARVTLTVHTDDASNAKLPVADLVVIGTLLNELPAPMRLPMVHRAIAALADDGAVIILEPALRETTRALHELRDAILATGSAHVFAPCTRKNAPCPALADPTDWCHEHRSVKLPPRTAELARLTHLRDDGLKFSYLVLRKAPAMLDDDPAAWRIVGTPWAQKGKLEVQACSPAGYTKLRLLKRHRASETRTIEEARRGDLVSLVDEVAGERVEITQRVRRTRLVPD